jgi:SRSO17 transposase
LAWCVVWGRWAWMRPSDDHDVVTQHIDRMTSALSIDLNNALQIRAELEADLAGLFPRRESRAHAMAYIRALASDLPRKNGWSISEWAGDARPDGKQRLLYKDKWDESAARDAVRAFAVRHLGDADGGLVFDETGQEKAGRATAGVGRQYTGTAGKITNAVVAVYVTYASRHGHCLIDGDLYAQQGWFTDPQRFAQAGFDKDHRFRTKPQIAVEQAERILTDLPVAWMAADEVYGRSATFRRYFEDHQIAYVVAVGMDFHVVTKAGIYRADLLARTLPSMSWNRRSCGQGAKGPRVYDWAMLATTSPYHVLLVRRSVTKPDDLAYFYAFTPEGQPFTLARIVAIAGYRWMVEEDFQQSKGQAGLDHTQARRYRSWLRHAVLALAALAIQAVTAAKHRANHPAAVLPTHGDDDPPEDYGLIALTVPETHRLFMLHDELRGLPSATARQRADFRQRWSTWRRRHQARARWFHHRTRLAQLAW